MESRSVVCKANTLPTVLLLQHILSVLKVTLLKLSSFAAVLCTGKQSQSPGKSGGVKVGHQWAENFASLTRCWVGLMPLDYSGESILAYVRVKSILYAVTWLFLILALTWKMALSMESRCPELLNLSFSRESMVFSHKLWGGILAQTLFCSVLLIHTEQQSKIFSLELQLLVNYCFSFLSFPRIGLWLGHPL